MIHRIPGPRIDFNIGRIERPFMRNAEVQGDDDIPEIIVSNN